VRELALHILDLLENSIRAGATVVSVGIIENREEDRLELTVEDNGPGLAVGADRALDPFYTTKEQKHTGLGLSLFRAAAEEANGTLTLANSALGGLAISASMQLSHVDRRPLGDVAASLSMVLCTNPEVDVRCRIKSPRGEWSVRASEIARRLGSSAEPFAVAREVANQIQEATAGMAV